MAEAVGNARVQIGKAANGRPSIKIDGREVNMLIGTDIALRFVDDDQLGHWELAVTFIEPEVSVDVEAEVRGA